MAAATKYHVNRETGRAGICRATKKGCPLGEDTPHFNSKEEAKAHIEKTEEKNNSQFSTVKKKDSKSDKAKIIANGLKKYNLTTETIKNKVDNVLSGYSNGQTDYHSYLDFDYDYIPEEECGTYGGYNQLSGVYSVDADVIRDNIIESLTNDQDINIPRNELDNLRSELSPIIGKLVHEHGFDRVRNYYAESESDYYQDRVVSVEFDNDLGKQNFVNDVMELVDGTYNVE